MMRRFIKYFLQGILVIAPIAVTIYVIAEVLIIVDSILPFAIPGLGLIVVIGSITLVGFTANHFVSDRLKGWFDRLIKKAPVVNLIYSAVKDVLNALLGNKKSFNQPVIVQLNENSETRRLGFITDQQMAELSHLGPEFITVYCPHSYNVSGNIYLVKRQQVQKLDLPASDVMKYVVSAGVTEVRPK